MAENLSGGIPWYEADDLKEFTLTATATKPQTVAFKMYDPLGAVLNPGSYNAANSGVTVGESGSDGHYYFQTVLPSTPGFYVNEWIAYDAASRTGRVKDHFEIRRTEAVSFYSYGDIYDIMRTARQIMGRHDITARDLRDYMQPADNRIDMHLGGIEGITVPLSPVPPIVREWCKNITLWNFYTDRFGVNREDEPPALKARYDEAIKLMSGVQSGNLVFHMGEGVIYRSTEIFESSTQNYRPIFNSRDWETQRVDPQWRADDFDGDSREDEE